MVERLLQEQARLGIPPGVFELARACAQDARFLHPSVGVGRFPGSGHSDYVVPGFGRAADRFYRDAVGSRPCGNDFHALFAGSPEFIVEVFERLAFLIANEH